jgi:DnaJ-class molecular chaperone
VTGSGVMILLVFIMIVGYVGSLWINPWVKCSRCNGKPRRKGLIFSYALHLCSKCKGTGRQLRLGRRFIFGPPQ